MAMLEDGGPITVRVYKRKSSNAAIVWANTYEFTQNAPGYSLAAYQALADGLVEAETFLHYGSTEFIRVVVSTQVEDGKPYNPLSFVAIPVDATGDRDETGVQVEPLQMCLRVAKQVEFGRQGFMLYRNALSEGEVVAPAGVPVLDFSNISTAFSAFRTSMQQFTAGTPQFKLVLASASNIRSVTDLLLAGVTVKKFNNRYFDRVLS